MSRLCSSSTRFPFLDEHDEVEMNEAISDGRGRPGSFASDAWVRSPSMPFSMCPARDDN